MPCYLCDAVQTDPAKGASPWAVAVVAGEQVLVCPACQNRDPRWGEKLDRCPRCSSTRLKVVLGSVICRGCGNDFEPGVGEAPTV